MADEKLHETDEAQDNLDADIDGDTQTTDAATPQDETAETGEPDGAAETTEDEAEGSADDDASDGDEDAEDENYGIPMDKVQAVLNATADEDMLTPQMQRMMHRQEENTKRVEESIKGTKSNPRWFVPLFCALMIIGLVWAVIYYLTSDYPIPNIGAWNLLIAFAIIMVGFIMTMWWR